MKEWNRFPRGTVSNFVVTTALLMISHVAANANAWSCVRSCSFDSSNNVFNISLMEQNPGAVDSGNNTWLYGIFTVQMKLQEGYTGGTITAFYLVDTETSSNSDPDHSEIDLELYGGKDARHMVFASNIYAGGKQNLDQLYFPLNASEPNNYTIQWNKNFISWKVNGVPFRVLYRDYAHPWPEKPMQLRVSIWDSSSFTSLKADYANTGPVVTQVQIVEEGAKGCQMTGAPLSPPNCPDWSDAGQPWNAWPTTDESGKGEAIRQKNFINSFGWDDA